VSSPPPPIEILAQAFRVDECSVLIWRDRPRSHFKSAWAHRRFEQKHAGKPVGTWTTNGYLYVGYRGSKLRAHRVVWALAHGRWPVEDIDHINGDRSDNRLENLREVTRQQNLQNTARRKDNTTGITGVRRMRGRWQARIFLDGQYTCLGTFDDLSEAAAVRKAAEMSHGYHPNHGRQSPIVIGEGGSL
jgi:HNH endonuclease